MPASRNFLLSAALIASFAVPALAQDDDKIDWKTGGKWPHLAQYIGTYEYAAVLDDKDVSAEISKLLKGQNIDLKTELEVSAPIGFENDCLTLQGNQQHTADKHRAYVEVCIHQGSVNIAIFDTDKITVYSDANDYKYLTDGMRTWIYFQNHTNALIDRPDNVQLVVEP